MLCGCVFIVTVSPHITAAGFVSECKKYKETNEQCCCCLLLSVCHSSKVAMETSAL